MIEKRFFVLAALLLCGGLFSMAQNKDLFEVYVEPDHLVFKPTKEFKSYRIYVLGPICRLEQGFDGSKTGVIELKDAKGKPLEDGRWTYQIDARPIWDREEEEILLRAREEGDYKTLIKMLPNREDVTQTGYFTIERGEAVDPSTIEDGKKVASFTRDQVFFDDLIVDGSACIGFDCVNGEVFGFDTIRLKENNLRIKFEDTSTAASFPTNDWQLTANDSANGGASKFSIDDVSSNRTPFTVEANAPSHSLYVDDAGRVGFGTSTPVAELHVKDGDTPTLRLEQDTSSGFGAQTWDVAGNETNFFVRDATNGSQLPLRIRPGADSNALFIDSDNDIGMGIASPDAAVHIRRTDGSAMLLVEDTDVDGSDDALLKVISEVKASFKLVNNFSGAEWEFFNGTAGFRVDDGVSGSAEFELRNDDGIRLGEDGADWLLFDANGDASMDNDLTVDGVFSNPSDVNLKEEFEAVDPSEVLDKLVALPITTWSYKREDGAARHMGVMAQDFHAAFGLGEDDRYLTSIDPDGVAMAAIQGLNQKVETVAADKETRIAELERDNEALEARLAELEAMMRTLTEQREK